MSPLQSRNTGRTVLSVLATLVMIICLGLLFLTELPTWPVLIITLLVLVPCQVAITKMKGPR